jgi:hypothetical protein
LLASEVNSDLDENTEQLSDLSNEKTDINGRISHKISELDGMSSSEKEYILNYLSSELNEEEGNVIDTSDSNYIEQEERSRNLAVIKRAISIVQE